MSEAQMIADECERAIARLRRLRASLEPFKGWRPVGAAAGSPDVLEALAPAEGLASTMETFVQEVRRGMHADPTPELAQVRAAAKMLWQVLAAVEESLSTTLGQHGWKLADPRDMN